MTTKDENGNVNCTDCKDCRNCIDCINCTNCVDCTSCTYCENCTDQPILNAMANTWIICLRKDQTLSIGCQNHSVDEWMHMSDERIDKMNRYALKFWKIWKPIIEVLSQQDLKENNA